MGKERQYGLWCDKTNTKEGTLKGYLIYRFPKETNKAALLLDAGWWNPDTGNFNVNVNLELPSAGEVLLGRSQRNVARVLRENFNVRRSITALSAKKAREREAQTVNVQFYAIIPDCPTEDKMGALPELIKNAIVTE